MKSLRFRAASFAILGAASPQGARSRKASFAPAMLVALLMLALAACLVCAPAPAAYADDAGFDDVDWSKTGSITLTLSTSDDATPVPGAQITLYKVATLSQDAQGFVPETGFEAWDFSDIADLTDADLGAGLASRVAELGIKGSAASTSAAGTLTFSSLDLGLYLLVQTGSAEGFADVKPFVVAVPNNEDGVLVYDVDASPKVDTQSLVDVSVKKSWNDANASASSRPSSVSVQLYRSGSLVDTVTLNASNNWAYSWKNLAKSDGYSVREVGAPAKYKATYSQVTAKDGALSFTVTNSTSLPQTGLLLWPVVLMAFAGLVCLVAGAALLLWGRRRAGRDA